MSARNGRPEISVVIATRRRETRLAFALESLAEQTIGTDRFEVVVVRADDALEPPLTEAPAGLRARFVASRPGPALQRNVGWRTARGRWIAFTDDDCRAAPDWLERMLQAAAEREAILQGRTEPDPHERHLYWGLARSWRITEQNDWYATCNIVYDRATLERVNGFDEGFPAAWGEDTDLGFRAAAAGTPLRYVDDALVWHAVLPRTFREAVRESRRLAATPVVIRRHPEHRRGLYAGVFVSSRHAWLPVAILGALALRRRPELALLAAAPYLKRTIDWRRPSPLSLLRQVARLPVRVALDLAEMDAIARSAYRNRVLVL